jgi:predicted TIM-barrel fold metal-dependent hydrolase
VAIDFHAHLAREDPDAPPRMRDLFDVEGYLEKQADAGIERSVLSYPLEDEGEQMDDVRGEHDFLADLLERYPDRFAALAAFDPFGGPDWLAEGVRALELGFCGFCFPTSREGRYLDSDLAQDAFALADERSALIFLHPSTAPIELERVGNAVLRSWIGRPYDTGICLSRMLLADTLAKYPNVRLVAAHSGGALPMLIGRLDHVYEGMKAGSGGGPPGGGPPSGGPPGGGPPGGGPPGGGPPKGPRGGGTVPEHAVLHPSIEGGPPSERLGQIYLDTASYHPAALAGAVAAVGIDRIVLGTDFPPAGDSPHHAIKSIDQSGLSEGERNKILGENARGLLERVPEWA